MSGIGRYLVDAVVLEHRSPTQLAREHGVSKRWVFELLRRFREGGKLTDCGLVVGSSSIAPSPVTS